MDIICRKLANEMIYAYHYGRFWRWDEGRSIWKESHLMAQKFERAKGRAQDTDAGGILLRWRGVRSAG